MWGAARLEKEWEYLSDEEKVLYRSELAKHKAASKEGDDPLLPANRAMRAVMDERQRDGFYQLRKVLEIFGPAEELGFVKKAIEKLPEPVMKQAGLFG